MSQTKSVLLKTSASSDVQYSGGEILIAGLQPIKQTNVINFSQIDYRAEVRQVVTIGNAYTPANATKYSLSIGDVNRRDHGYTEQLKVYSYTTPDDVTTLGGSAALQREAIHLALIAQINADGGNYVAAVTLGGGNGFTITDDAGYYPYNRQGMNNRKGASTVKVITNLDGTGWASTNYTLTTAAVYSVGEGLRLLNDAPIFDFMTGNLISGEFDAPVTITGEYAVSGQRYNMFSISYLNEVNIPTITGIKAYSTKTAQIFVDNGTGASTANLAGYIAFEKAMHRGLFNQFSNDPNAQVDFLDNVILFQGAAGAVPTTTGENKMLSDAKWVYNQIGTQTITVPTPSNTGLNLDQDLTDTEGAEYTPSLLTGAPQEFVVGKTDFSIYARVVAADWTDAGWLIGFRRKAAHAADFNNYTDLAGIGTIATVAGGTPNGDLISTNGILNNAATVTTSTTVVPADGAYVTVEVLVNKAGNVTCKVNDVVYPVYSVGTTPLVFDAGDIMIPTVRAVNIGGGDPDLVLNEVAAVASASWKY